MHPIGARRSPFVTQWEGAMGVVLGVGLGTEGRGHHPTKRKYNATWKCIEQSRTVVVIQVE